MSYCSLSGSSSGRSLICCSYQNPSRSDWAGTDSDCEAVELKTENTTLIRSGSKQLATTSNSFLPSVEDLDRMDRWVALQERMANLNSIARQGHTYGKLTVARGARAIRGNIYDDSASLPCLRNHTYGNSDAKDGGMIWEGDISIAALSRVRQHSSFA